MTPRDWLMLMDPRLGDPLADIQDWMLFPFSAADIEKRAAIGKEAVREPQ